MKLIEERPLRPRRPPVLSPAQDHPPPPPPSGSWL